jgi:DNA polymerase IV (DinB-like DNA polymerase)
MRIIMHVDLDYFYAQCEELRNPSLKGKPVVICVYSARGNDSGAVSTSNYKAREYGVKAGISIREAKKLLKDKDAVFLPVDEPYYTSVSDMVMSVLRRYADVFEQVSIDEAFLDVSNKCRDMDNAYNLAKSMKDELKSSIGLTCSIGISVNKLVAKMASDHRKPDGLTIVRDDDIIRFISGMNVGKLLWVGRKTEERLNEMGIYAIEDLARVDAQRLIEVFGKKMGIYLYNASRGIDDEPVRDDQSVKQISRITTLKKNTNAIDDMLEDLHMLCNDVYKRVMESDLLFRSVGIILVHEDLRISSRSRSLKRPSNSLDDILRNARELLEDALHDGIIVRRLGVKVEGLMDIKGQDTLQRFIDTA